MSFEVPDANAGAPRLPPEQGVEEAEVDAVFLGAKIRVQCCECGTVLEAVFRALPPDQDELERELICATCSQEKGVRVYIPIAFLVGADIASLDDHPDDVEGTPVDAEQPFDVPPAQVQDDVGPMTREP